MSTTTMTVNLLVWRQAGPTVAGKMVPYRVERRLARHVVSSSCSMC